MEIILVCTASLSSPSLAGSLIGQCVGFSAACVVGSGLAEEPHDGQVCQGALTHQPGCASSPARSCIPILSITLLDLPAISYPPVLGGGTATSSGLGDPATSLSVILGTVCVNTTELIQFGPIIQQHFLLE